MLWHYNLEKTFIFYLVAPGKGHYNFVSAGPESVICAYVQRTLSGTVGWSL